MSDYEPVDVYFTVEMWQNRSKSLGWRMTSPDGDPFETGLVGPVVREVAQDIISEIEGSPVAVALHIHENGICYADYQRERDFSDRENFTTLSENLDRLLTYLATGKWPKRTLWSVIKSNLFWLWKCMTGQIKPHQNGRVAPGYSAQPPVNEALETAQNGSENSSRAPTGNVVPFAPRNKSR